MKPRKIDPPGRSVARRHNAYILTKVDDDPHPWGEGRVMTTAVGAQGSVVQVLSLSLEEYADVTAVLLKKISKTIGRERAIELLKWIRQELSTNIVRAEIEQRSEKELRRAADATTALTPEGAEQMADALESSEKAAEFMGVVAADPGFANPVAVVYNPDAKPDEVIFDNPITAEQSITPEARAAAAKLVEPVRKKRATRKKPRPKKGVKKTRGKTEKKNGRRKIGDQASSSQVLGDAEFEGRAPEGD